MPDRRRRRHAACSQIQAEDGIRKPERGEIARMLKMDMAAHHERTAEFNDGWKRALCLASVGLALVSMLKAVEKAREGDRGWVERGLTSTNATLIAMWVGQLNKHGRRGCWALAQPAAVALSLFQLVGWWNVSSREEHADFPAAVILLAVALAAVASMNSTLNAADNALRASNALEHKVSTGRHQ